MFKTVFVLGCESDSHLIPGSHLIWISISYLLPTSVLYVLLLCLFVMNVTRAKSVGSLLTLTHKYLISLPVCLCLPAFIYFFKDVIYLSEAEKACTSRRVNGGWEAEGEADSPPRRKPATGLDPSTLES